MYYVYIRIHTRKYVYTHTLNHTYPHPQSSQADAQHETDPEWASYLDTLRNVATHVLASVGACNGTQVCEAPFVLDVKAPESQ